MEQSNPIPNGWTQLESMDIPSLKTSLSAYVHDQSQLKVLYVPTPGPENTATFVIPTETSDSCGLPHTLEHLIFMGSAKFPRRGFLDNAVIRCISDGTNAWTDVDNTAYLVTTVGSKGFLQILPIFTDHILNPTLNEDQFITEVYHVDGEGKEAGVVFCEMQGRENTMEDILDLEIRKAVYAKCNYEYETGGLTHQIATLTNKRIRKYHESMYYPANMSVILTGHNIPIAEALSKFSECDLPSRSPAFSSGYPWSKQLPRFRKSVSKVVPFPSNDTESNTIALAWRGPPSEDVEACVAIDVLLDYLTVSSSSPFHQRFVETSNPIANCLDGSRMDYIETVIEITLEGIPTNREEDDDSSSEEGGSASGSESDSSEEGGLTPWAQLAEDSDEEDDLLEPGEVKRRVFEVMQLLCKASFPMEAIRRTVRKLKVELLEEYENDPTELVQEMLVPDIVLRQFEKGKLGRCMNAFEIYSDLEKRDGKFWQSLLQKYFISAPVAEIIMVASSELAEKNEERAKRQQQQRVEQLGPSGLEKCGKVLAEAIENNKVNLTEEDIAAFPPIPEASEVETLPSKHMKGELSGIVFMHTQVPTMFTKFSLLFNIADIPLGLRPYLPLFQTMIFETDVHVPGQKLMSFTKVDERVQDISVDLGCGVGFGNNGFMCNRYPDVFRLWGKTEPHKFGIVAQFARDVFRYSVWDKDRIKSIVTNMLSDITETVRDGEDTLEAVGVATCFPKEGNYYAITIFQQKMFLKHVLEQIKNPDGLQSVVEALDGLRSYLSAEPSRALAHFSGPMNHPEDIAATFIRAWTKVDGESSKKSKKRKKNVDPTRLVEIEAAAVAKLKQHSFLPLHQDSIATVPKNHGVAVSIQGVESSWLEQWVPCNLRKVSSPHESCALHLLCEVLSRSEGPLCEEIRGKGLAYGASIHFWASQGVLCFECHESSAPAKALAKFHEILMQLRDTPETVLTTTALDSAKASCLYDVTSSRSTGARLANREVDAVLKGYDNFSAEMEHDVEWSNVTFDDLIESRKYLMQFLEENQRATLMTAGPNLVQEAVAELRAPPLGIPMEVSPVEDFFKPYESSA